MDPEGPKPVRVPVPVSEPPMSEHDRLLLEHQIGDEVMLRGELHVIDISDVDERRFLRRVTSPQKAA